MAQDEQFELLEAVMPTIGVLLKEHKARREHWYAHEYVPWEQGRNYRTEPWDESQCSLSPTARTSLVLNLLTEDNLPYYHQALAGLTEYEPLQEWLGIWTAEEAQHSIAIRSYLLTSRNCDPVALENDRLATMKAGFHMRGSGPAAMFSYTAAQELATRVSHRNTGKYTDDPVAYEIMGRIATDENHHFMFYRGVMSAMLESSPAMALLGVWEQLSEFKMPGTTIPGFVRRSVDIARAGIYNLRIHHDRVLVPLIRDWRIADLTGLSAKARELQEKILDLPREVMRKAEIMERRLGMT